MNEQVPEKKSSMKPLLIILALMAIPTCIAGCGIIGAIAIPAFLRYIKVSKTSEAPMMTRQIAQAAKMHFVEHCSFPTAIAQHTSPKDCCGGKKCIGDPGAVAAFGDLGVSVADPTYFSYETRREGNRYRVIATADLECGGPMHTVELDVEGTSNPDGSCDAVVSSPRILNELE